MSPGGVAFQPRRRAGAERAPNSAPVLALHPTHQCFSTSHTGTDFSQLLLE